MPLEVVRWGWSEYETPEVPGLPDGARLVAVPAAAEAPLGSADLLVVPSTRRVRRAEVARLSRCRLVLTTTSGFDQLDLEALREAGIGAARLPLARRDAVVETTLAMLLALARRLGTFQEAARAGRWDRARLAEHGATRLGTVGVVGVGVIGSRVAELLEALGARVLRCDPVLPDSVPLDALLRESDAVSLHCELTPRTRGMIDSGALAAMRPGAILVNTARGALLDLDAALAAVRDGRLAGLGLDVFPREPADLAAIAGPRVLVTPHAAGWHPELGARIAEGIAEAARALLEGREMPWRVV